MALPYAMPLSAGRLRHIAQKRGNLYLFAHRRAQIVFVFPGIFSLQPRSPDMLRERSVRERVTGLFLRPGSAILATGKISHATADRALSLPPQLRHLLIPHR